MRILWICNIMLPVFAIAHGLPYSNREGWLSGCYERILRDIRSISLAEGMHETAEGMHETAEGMHGTAEGMHETAEGLELGVCFPVNDENLAVMREQPEGTHFYGFIEDLNHPERYTPELEKKFKEILADFQPDVVHIFGTEFPHTLAAVRAYGRPERTLLGIQGLCSVIADRYLDGLPDRICRRATFRDLVRQDSLKQQQEKFRERGKNEILAIEAAGNITGRTAFDRQETFEINPDAKYFEMNETLRKEFYEGQWQAEKSITHTIFLTQGDYPIKGFHFMLEAMSRIIRRYPDARLYVAGNSLTGEIDRSTVTDDKAEITENSSRYPLFMRISEYGRYLNELIHKYNLSDKISFLGKLTAGQMKEQYLRCSVYVCPSVIENSPNSLGEAMLLGVPCAAAATGGIPDMLTNGTDGLLFEKCNPQAIAEAVDELWKKPEKARKYGINAAKHAHITHDPDRNHDRLMEIYRTINASAGKES